MAGWYCDEMMCCTLLACRKTFPAEQVGGHRYKPVEKEIQDD